MVDETPGAEAPEQTDEEFVQNYLAQQEPKEEKKVEEPAEETPTEVDIETKYAEAVAELNRIKEESSIVKTKYDSLIADFKKQILKGGKAPVEAAETPTKKPLLIDQLRQAGGFY